MPAPSAKKRQAARQLLGHLVQLAGSSIYEDDSISICRQGEEIRCRLADSASCTIAHADGHTLVTLRPKT